MSFPEKIDGCSTKEKLMFLTEDSLVGVEVGADGYAKVDCTVDRPTVEEVAACPPREVNACRRPKRRGLLSCSPPS